MRILVGLENNLSGRSLAWALDYPGCFAYGRDESEALLNLPRALVNHAARVAERSPHPWFELGDFDLRLVETWSCYHIDENYDLAAEGRKIRAWFRHDWKPLTAIEVRRGLELLGWGRADLLELTSELPREELERKRPGEYPSIHAMLNHIAEAEWDDLDQLGPPEPPRALLSTDVFTRLALARARLEAALPGLAGRERVVGAGGELWSPRKLLRRALWHELDTIGRIARLLVGQ